jgi:hypothetical protein
MKLVADDLRAGTERRSRLAISRINDRSEIGRYLTPLWEWPLGFSTSRLLERCS